MKSSDKLWTEDQAMRALHLYFQIPFGQYHKSNKDVIALASRIGRTPDAVAMKLSNFASMDPELDRKGLDRSSKLDKDVWGRYSTDFEALVRHAASSQEKIEASNVERDTVIRGADVETIAKRRVGQSFFRNVVLESYQARCCITGIDIPSLLVASHIVPWRDDVQNRLNPRNGLCLSNLHDKAFDQGLLTLDEDLRVVLSSELRNSAVGFSKQCFDAFEGRTISSPLRYRPDQQFLEHHRQNVFVS